MCCLSIKSFISTVFTVHHKRASLFLAVPLKWVAQMHYITAIPNFTWTSGCPGLCPWSPSLLACSDGRAHSVGCVFALGDPPCSHAVASPSASQNHSGFHSPLKEKKHDHFIIIIKKKRIMISCLYLKWKTKNSSAAGYNGLTLYWSPGVQPCFHHLISHFNFFYTSNHSKGKMSL